MVAGIDERRDAGGSNRISLPFLGESRPLAFDDLITAFRAKVFGDCVLLLEPEEDDAREFINFSIAIMYVEEIPGHDSGAE
jgi:hypothetical protein